MNRADKAGGRCFGANREPRGRAVTKTDDKRMGLWALVREDWAVNGRDWTRPGFRAMFMYRFGVWRMGLRPKILRAPFSLLYRYLHRRIRNHYGIELHYTTKIGRRFRIAHQGAIVIHEHATIGDDCTIRQGATIGAAGDYSEEKAPVIGNSVSIGAGAMVLGRITVGDGATIGPNALVTMNVPAGAVATATPARIIPPPKPKDDD